MYDVLPLITLADVFSAATGRTLISIGTAAANNEHLFARLKDGKGCNTATAQRAWAFFQENWPDDVPWPLATPRPEAKAPTHAERRAAAQAKYDVSKARYDAAGRRIATAKNAAE